MGINKNLTDLVGIVFIVSMMVLGLTGCLPKDEKWTCPQLSDNKGQKLLTDNQSDPKIVKIQIDGTLSMQGFVKIRGSRYVQTLDVLDNAVLTAFKDPKIEYYRFGLISEKLLGEKSSVKAQTLDFYKNDPKLQNAKFSAAVNKHTKGQDNNELTIIVTDLYQKESSQEDPIITLLKNSYIQTGKAVGFIPIKSEFKGKIYDVGKENKNFEWTAETNPKTFHPFYVIVLGKYEHITRYFEQVRNAKLNFIEHDKLVIFYHQFLEKPLSLKIDDNQRVLPKGIESRKSLNDGQVRLQVTNPNSTDIDILKINNKYDGNKQGISYTVDYYPLPYTLQIEPTTKPNIAEFFRSSNNKFEKIQSELVNFSNWDIQNKQKKISFSTDLTAIKDKGLYRFAFDIVPIKIQDQSWWSSWSFDEEEAKSWITDPKKFDGSRTYNLLSFLQSLSAITFKEIDNSKSALGRFCYVIQKE